MHTSVQHSALPAPIRAATTPAQAQPPPHTFRAAGRQGAPAPPTRRLPRCAAHPPRTVSYTDLLKGSKEAQEALHWTPATVIENKGASADGTVRTLVLSVEDAVVYADGRRVRHVQEHSRWGDKFLAPGQFVGVRYRRGESSAVDGATASGQGDLVLAQKPFALSCSPYDSRSSSSNLDACIVQIVASRGLGAEPDDAALAELPPGAQIEVSDVLGWGFCSLFNSSVGLQSSLEEGRPVLMIGVGTRGMAPLRAALAWTPVLAHASAHSVALVYVADSPAAAAYLSEWDGWRAAGVKVVTKYLNSEGSSVLEDHAGVQALLEEALFEVEGGLAVALGGDPRKAAVVLAGLPAEVAGQLARRLSKSGVVSERLLVMDADYA